MNRNQFFVALGLAIALGLVVSLLTGGFQLPFTLTPGTSTAVVLPPEMLEAQALRQSTPLPRDPEPEASPTPLPAAPAPMPVSFTVVDETGPALDLSDVLLLSDASAPTDFDINYCKIATYYGLLCKAFDLQQNTLVEDAFKDESGAYFRLIGISAAHIPLLSPEELDLLMGSVVEKGGTLLVYEVTNETDAAALKRLTGDALTDVTRPRDSVRNWTVTSEAPEVTQEFSGMYIELTSVMKQLDYGLEIDPESRVTTLLVSEDDYGHNYPIFARFGVEAGRVYVNAGSIGEEPASLASMALRHLYYAPEKFSVSMPLMFTMRHVMGTEAWHSEVNYANLTLDDPSLTPDYHLLDYEALLAEMDEHDFVTTIGFMPINYQRSKEEIIRLLRNNPHRYSIAQHGNNHDGYEFYYYEPPVNDTSDDQSQPASGEAGHTARPFSEQEADLVEGLDRMLHHQQSTGIPFERVMIFPVGISPEDTLGVLKRLNFIATVNAGDVPLGATRPTAWDYGMYTASFDYANFPVVERRLYVDSYGNPNPFILDAAFDLFIDRPALFWSHPHEGELFTKGIDEFSLLADRVNTLPGALEWRTLGDVLKRAYTEKRNDDGSFDVRMSAHAMTLSNRSSAERIYHVSKPETFNVPIESVTVDGVEVPYRVVDGRLVIDLRLPPQTEVEIMICYTNQPVSETS